MKPFALALSLGLLALAGCAHEVEYTLPRQRTTVWDRANDIDQTTSYIYPTEPWLGSAAWNYPDLKLPKFELPNFRGARR